MNDNFKPYEPWKNEFFPNTKIHKSFDRFVYAHHRQQKAIMQTSFDFVQRHGEQVVLNALDKLFSFSSIWPLPCYINAMIPQSEIFGKFGLTKYEYISHRIDDFAVLSVPESERNFVADNNNKIAKSLVRQYGGEM